MKIKVEPFKNNIGASISYDLKLTEPKIINEIKETLNNYGFVCFRDQNLEPGEYLKFAEQLGKIKEYPMLRDLENYKGITVVERKEMIKGNLTAKDGTQIVAIWKKHQSILVSWAR